MDHKNKIKFNKNCTKFQPLNIIQNKINCFYIVHSGEDINYLFEEKKLNVNGKTKIISIKTAIEKLDKNYSMSVTKVKKVRKILEEMQFFPYREIIPVVLEMLKFQGLELQQIYFCLKILECITLKNKVLKTLDYSRILNTLFCVYFNFQTFQKFILNLIGQFDPEHKKTANEFIAKLLGLDDKNIVFYYGILKYSNHFQLGLNCIEKIKGTCSMSEMENFIKESADEYLK